MKRWKWGAAILAVFLLAGIIYFVRQPYIFGQTKDGYLFVSRAEAGMPVTLSYRHSVMKTPVEEYLAVNESVDGLVLKSTRYQSQGVGLPFLATDGDFRRDGPWLVMENMNRAYPTLTFANGMTNHEILTVGTKSYHLDDLLPLDEKIYIYVCPLYKGLWMRKTFH
jgi:hypothetical protein